ncbi:G2/mitotic-specific cyclin-B2 [Mactra antiquata]
MATRATTRLAAANNFNKNTDGVIPGARAKTFSSNTSKQSNLADIGNKQMITEDRKKGALKELNQGKNTYRPQKNLRKHKATTSLKAIAEDNVVSLKENIAAVIHPPTELAPIVDFPTESRVVIHDIDAEDKENTQLVSEYVNDIYKYMLHLEDMYPIRANYLEGQDINGKMRAILLDWLCKVHSRFHLLQETLYLTIAIIDRFLQDNPVIRKNLQLVSVTAMLIASKYEEMYAPVVDDFVFITDNAYTRKEILQMEQIILKKLNFSFGRPLCIHFLRRNSKAGQVDALTHTMAKYLMELTVMEYNMVHYKPSQIAAAALCLSMKILDNSPWTKTLHHYSTYSEESLIGTMKKLASCVVKAETNKLNAVKSKYESSKLMKVSSAAALKSPIITQLAETSS